MATYKILVPKPIAKDELGTDVELAPVDTIVDAKEEWKDNILKTFVENGWAQEVKVDATENETGEPVRARDSKGRLKGDDPSTPDVNEAWEGGKAPKKKTTKKSTAKKTTKKTTKKSTKK